MSTNNKYAKEWEEIQLSPEEQSERETAMAEIEKLDKELRLDIPEEATEDEIPLWKALNRMIRKMYQEGSIERSHIDQMYEIFYSQNPEEKRTSLTNIHREISLYEENFANFDRVWEEEETVDILEELVERLPLELREAFLNYLETGQEIPSDLATQAQATVAGDEVAEARLAHLLGSNSGTETSSQAALAPKTLSPADLRAKFNVAPKDVITRKQANEEVS